MSGSTSQDKMTSTKPIKKIKIDKRKIKKKMKKKIDKRKIKKKLLTKKCTLQKSVFKKQVYRKDMLENMLNNMYLQGKELFEFLLKEETKQEEKREAREGWLFETICQILISLKCIKGINYNQIYEGQLQNLRQIKNIKTLLNVLVEGGGNNISDMTIGDDETLFPFSVKYRGKFGETDVSKIYNTVTKQKISDNFKIVLIVKNKKLYKNHTYKNEYNIDKELIDTIIENNLLFDKKDIIIALDVFCERFSNNLKSIDEFIELINAEYLLSPRQQLVKRLHQVMTLYRFKNSFLKNKYKLWCIAHKCRSGKSLTMLLIAKYLLENGHKKILIMTSVPATIDSFKQDLENFIDFKNINYKLQKDFNTPDETFNGIVFCSVQYLKMNGKKKKDLLKKMAFDAIFVDESHHGSSTDKTKKDILNADIEEISKNIKLTIFASGTADKTKRYYGIHSSCIYEWEIEDEAYMKELQKNIPIEKYKELKEAMVKRHGNTFTECFENETINKDYSECPSQVLMKHTIPKELIAEINAYNAKCETNYGYNCGSLFALKQIINEKDKVEYVEEFELCKTTDGLDILKGFFDYIISENKMRETIMKKIEKTQTSRGSRKSTQENPLLFIMYLPTHTRNNTISLLQKTIIKFMETHHLWEDYNIEYSNGKEDSLNVKEEYNKFITSIMKNTKDSKKKGCILLLGNKGSVGITYEDCDVTISLDDGHNIDNQKQRFSRALTSAEGKTVGINVDLNVQRAYLYMNDVIHKHRRNTRTTRGDAEILYYLYVHNIFLFNPQQFNNGTIITKEIMSYYEKEVLNMLKEIDDTHLLEGIICDDDMRDLIKLDFQKAKINKKINEDLEGEQQDCPKGDKTKVQIDAPNDIDNDKKDENKLTEEETVTIEDLTNKTYEMCQFLIPLLALISKSCDIFDFKDVLTSESKLMKSLLEDKIENIKNNYNNIVNIMNNIIDNNAEIIDNIRTIYRTAPACKLRDLIATHFIPTNEEKKKNAEVATPVNLVNEILEVVPLEFWKKPQKVFEPCCGKGNFVLGIFDKFYKGLEEMYPDKIERCEVIMTVCIHYADITALNVFITTEVMKCHIQSHCGLDVLDYEFNNYTGDTLELNINEKWAIDGFDSVIGNPPYNSSGNTATGNTIWQHFTKKALNEWLIQNGYLLFVHPPGWRKPNTKRGKFYGLYKLMTKQNQMRFLSVHGITDGKKTFNCGTRYDWYLIEKNQKHTTTIVNDEKNNRIVIDMGDYNWLPNYNILIIQNILAKKNEDACPIIYNRSSYASDNKKYISKTKNIEYKYPVVHTMPKKGTRYIYSSRNDKGHFNISKVIFGDNGLNNAIIDMEGKYGMSENSMAIEINDLDEANYIKDCLMSETFKLIIKSCIIGNFRIDWRLFTYFKKDFWRDFI